MKNAGSQYRATRILISIIMANFITFLLMFWVKSVVLTPYVFFGSMLFSYLMSRTVGFRSHSLQRDKLITIMMLIAFIILTVPRATYLFSWRPDLEILTHSDDYARVLQIIAMTQQESYPLRSPSNSEFPFSFYYSSLYPFAALKLILPQLPIKFIISFISIIIYALILLSLVEISRGIFRNKTSVRVAVFCSTLFGGFDWIAAGGLFDLAGHFEWWQRSFNGNTQISSFFTAMFWAPHHFISAFSVIIAYFILFFSRKTSPNYIKFFIIFIVLASAFYSSPFAFIPVIIISVPLFKFLRRTFAFVPAAIIFLISLPPLEIFIGKLSEQSFAPSTFRFEFFGAPILDKILSFPIYAFVVPFVEFAGIPFLLFIAWKKLKQKERFFAIGSFLYFFSTYVLAYTGANNYSMRGMLIPSFIIFFLFAKHIQTITSFFAGMGERKKRSIILLLCAILAVGTLKEALGRFGYSIYQSNILFERHTSSPSITVTAMDMSVTHINFSEIQGVDRRQIYDFERPIHGLELSEFENWERELIRSQWPSQTPSSLFCFFRIWCSN